MKDKYYKTILEVEIISKNYPYTDIDLNNISYDTMIGEIKVRVYNLGTKEMDLD